MTAVDADAPVLDPGDGLTAEQRRIVEWEDGPLVVIAGAGTGRPGSSSSASGASSRRRARWALGRALAACRLAAARATPWRSPPRRPKPQ